MQLSRGQKRASAALKLVTAGGWICQQGCWEPNSGSLSAIVLKHSAIPYSCCSQTLFQLVCLSWWQSITKGNQPDSRQEPEQTVEKHCSPACSAPTAHDSQQWAGSSCSNHQQENAPDSSRGRLLGSIFSAEVLSSKTITACGWGEKNQQRQDPTMHPAWTQTPTQVAPHTSM